MFSFIYILVFRQKLFITDLEIERMSKIIGLIIDNMRERAFKVYLETEVSKLQYFTRSFYLLIDFVLACVFKIVNMYL